MKCYLKISLFLIVLLSLTSCIKVKTILTVNKDGSGTIQETVMMSKVFADMMNGFSAFDDPDTKPFTLFDEEKLKTEASGFGEGVQYQSGKTTKEGGYEGYTATYSFSDITKVKLSMDQDKKVDTGMPAGSPEEDEENEYYYFSFNGGSTPQLTINRKEKPQPQTSEETDTVEEMETPDSDENMGGEMENQLFKMFEGMQFDLSLVVNGKVTETNATYVDGSNITLLEMDFGEMMKNKEAFTQLTKSKPKTTEELKAFIDQMDGMKIELEKSVVVKFK